MCTIATRIEEARRGRGDDRVAVLDGRLVVVADGAGGVAGGARAAEAICGALTSDTRDWQAWLSQLDETLAAVGTAAAVVLAIADDGAITGASVGDCEAWIFGDGEPAQLTSAQTRKPLLGDGAMPVSFEARSSGGTLIVATDGLWKYLAVGRIAEIASLRPLESALDALVEGVRLSTGGLQDDVAIVMCALPAA